MKPDNVLMLVQGWIGLVGFCLFYCNPVTTTQTFMALPTGEERYLEQNWLMIDKAPDILAETSKISKATKATHRCL